MADPAWTAGFASTSDSYEATLGNSGGRLDLKCYLSKDRYFAEGGRPLGCPLAAWEGPLPHILNHFDAIQGENSKKACGILVPQIKFQVSHPPAAPDHSRKKLEELPR